MLNTMKGIARDTNKSLREETEERKKKITNYNSGKGGNMKKLKEVKIVINEQLPLPATL